jgi:predicted RNase H-like HicB family nuclease
MESRYYVSLKKSKEGYSVWVPGLPGCASQGANEQEALENIQDAIQEYLAVAVSLTEVGEIREVVALRSAIDEGDASGVAEGDVFARVRETLNLPQKPR